MGEFLLESQFFGLFLSLAFFQLTRWLNRKAGREVCQADLSRLETDRGAAGVRHRL